MLKIQQPNRAKLPKGSDAKLKGLSSYEYGSQLHIKLLV